MTAPFDEALVEAVARVVREWGVDCSCSEVAKRDGRLSSWCVTHAAGDFAIDVLAAVETALPQERMMPHPNPTTFAHWQQQERAVFPWRVVES